MSELPRWLSGLKKKKWSESVKNLPANAGDAGDVSSVPGSGKSPGSEMATHSSEYSFLGNPMDREAWQGLMGSQRVGHNWATEHAFV